VPTRPFRLYHQQESSKDRLCAGCPAVRMTRCNAARPFLFELTWKAAYLAAFALPSWLNHQVAAAVADDIQAVAMVAISFPCFSGAM
jgi:hypothetical protein